MKHTPGPWKYKLQEIINDPDDINSGYKTIPNYYSIIGRYGFFNLSDGNNSDSGFCASSYMLESDAKLLASAPELLEALQEAYKELKFHNWHNSTTGYKIEALIKTVTE